MIFSKLFQDVALWLGIGFSLLWSSILSNIYPLQKLELKTQDFLMGIFPPPAPPQEILLVKIRPQDFKKPELLEDPHLYANFVHRLLEEGAATVILNLRSNWVQTADHADNPIKELVRNHRDRLVLVIPTSCACLPNPTKWRPYNYFIPLNSGGQPLFPLKTVLGFSEYEPEEHDPSSLKSPSRRAHLMGNFIFSSNLDKKEQLDAAVWLGLKKFQKQQGQLPLAINKNYDGPLQELKLIMDSLEILQIEHSYLNIDPILEKLESVGDHLRQQLHHTCALSLKITPELREGLAVGLEKKLQELVSSEQLTLKVETKLQSLKEPTLNSLWLSAREGIYSFFCEAITNAIQHAQPPHGSATELKVSLSQQGDRCNLTIENDGSPLDESVLKIPYNQRKKGGYGTQLMENIASELPKGTLKRVVPSNGGMQVTLSWNLLS